VRCGDGGPGQGRGGQGGAGGRVPPAPANGARAVSTAVSSRRLRRLGWTVLALVSALYVGLPVAMAVVAVWPSREPVGAPPAGFREVVLTADDGVDLAAWYAPSVDGRAVLVVHGAGGSREAMRDQAVLLAGHGYGVLAIDLRGHGSSGGRTNRLGWEGTRDVVAAVAFLAAQPGVEAIGALGSSMGAEVLLGATAACPEILAVVADGATRRSLAELLALPAERSIVRNFTARVMFSAVRAFAGHPAPEPLLDALERSETSAFLLIAAGEDATEVAFNEVFADALGDRATLWVVPGVAHTGGFASDPAGYELRVVTFLDAALGR
jgi:uncharacterized protein